MKSISVLTSFLLVGYVCFCSADESFYNGIENLDEHSSSLGVDENHAKGVRYAVDMELNGVRLRMPYLLEDQPDLDQNARKLVSESKHLNYFWQTIGH